MCENELRAMYLHSQQQLSEKMTRKKDDLFETLTILLTARSASVGLAAGEIVASGQFGAALQR
jgi:hypothetical protein